MNILLSDWLPVYLKDGRRVKIAPYELTNDLKSNPAVSLAFNRPDLDATVIEMLIGMLQTFYCPDERVEGMDWSYVYHNPPDPDKLRAAFERNFSGHFTTCDDNDLHTRKVSEVFDLFGDGIRFMQDQSLSNETKIISPGDLLLDSDAVQSHFAKRQIKTLCSSCMTAVLYTLQARANSGGSGHMQSIRKGNAFTTIVKGDTLWETCWLNVLGKNTVQKYGDPTKNRPDDIFPWIKKSIKGLKLNPSEVSLFHCYWQMPRRIYLKSVNSGSCMLCHEEDTCVTEVVSSSKGFQYDGENRFHPLSPLVEKKDRKDNDKTHYELYEHNEYDCRYKHWLALTRTDPAPSVAAATKRNQAQKLWAFGYVCKSKLALAWDEGEFLIVTLPTGDKLEEKDAENVVRLLIDMASKAAEHLQKYAGKAVALIAKGEKGRKVKFPMIDKEPFSARFWQASENDFYSYIERLQNVVSGAITLEEVKLDWSKRVRFHALNVFDSLADFEAFDSETMSIIAEHRAALMNTLSRKEGKVGKIKIPQ
ncbi:MAG: type I-E CRISPR-associated protein Cse1/CasA [Nitrospirae bacterium]|nr:type I-E CRISPR-associated protein Cse1/CasA [Nitrospirota bacterium]